MSSSSVLVVIFVGQVMTNQMQFKLAHLENGQGSSRKDKLRSPRLGPKNNLLVEFTFFEP